MVGYLEYLLPSDGVVRTDCVRLLYEEVPDWQVDGFAISLDADGKHVIVHESPSKTNCTVLLPVDDRPPKGVT